MLTEREKIIQAYREKHKCGVREAVAAINKEERLQQLVRLQSELLYAQNWHDVRDVVGQIITLMIEQCGESHRRQCHADATRKASSVFWLSLSQTPDAASAHDLEA